jgi:hypothetical protein
MAMASVGTQVHLPLGLLVARDALDAVALARTPPRASAGIPVSPTESDSPSSPKSRSVGREWGPKKPDHARFWHDVFNLILLPVLVVITINALTEYWRDRTEKVWHYATIIAFEVYFVVDGLWIAVVPHCVKSARVVLTHHVLATFFVYVIAMKTEQSVFIEHREALYWNLLVEVNTWFLLARRTFKSGQLIIATCFYVSWLYFRVFIQAWVIWRVGLPSMLRHCFKKLDTDQSGTITLAEFGQQWNLIAAMPYYAFVCPLMQGVFLTLNLKWTYDLFQNVVRGLVGPKQSAEDAEKSKSL